MPTFQAFNRRNKAWVKYKLLKNNKVRILNVKEKEPLKRFKGVRVRGQVRRK